MSHDQITTIQSISFCFCDLKLFLNRNGFLDIFLLFAGKTTHRFQAKWVWGRAPRGDNLSRTLSGTDIHQMVVVNMPDLALADNVTTPPKGAAVVALPHAITAVVMRASAFTSCASALPQFFTITRVCSRRPKGL
jgi:hypothetical protein